MHRQVYWGALGRGRALVARQAGECLDQLHRLPAGPSGLAGMGDLAQYERLEHPPGDGKEHHGKDGTRVAVERDLRTPSRGREWIELAPHRGVVGLEARGTAPKQVECVLGSEPGGDERLVDSVTGNGIEGARRVADHESSTPRQNGCRPPHRQAMTT